jgi:aspartyl-tRNA(Asn)/glutamyl-tRNA(Gln) amidotransferase subunit A
MLQVIAGYDALDPSTVPVPVPDYTAHLERTVHGLKIGFPTNYYFELLDPEVETAVRQAIASLQALGGELREVALPMMQYAHALRIAGMADSVVTHEPYLQDHRQDYGPDVLYRLLAGQFVLGRDYAKAMKIQRLIKEEHAQVLQHVDVLVTPTAPVAAPRIDATTVTLGGMQHRIRGPGSGMISKNTSPSNATGLPAITVPCGFTTTGLPIGLQFIGKPFEETVLLQIAQTYEAISPSKGQRPSLVTA